MAIIKCDDVVDEPGIGTETTSSGSLAETYVESDEVSLGKILLAVESGFFISDMSSPALSDALTNTEGLFLLKDRAQGITDSFRADSNRYWTLDKSGNMKYMNTNIIDFEENGIETDAPPPFFTIEEFEDSPDYITTFTESQLGLTITKQSYIIDKHESMSGDLWKVYIEGGEFEDSRGGTFSRSTPLITSGSTFTDHAFQMNTPFSKKELEMFANIAGDVNIADVESDYDFFAKAYEEGIAPTNVHENALPHLYTEVKKSEDSDGKTVDLPIGYLRSWVSDILSNEGTMTTLTKEYENVAILDSVVDEENIIDSRDKSTSAFDILMAYANRENLFPMNVNVEVGSIHVAGDVADVMSEAEAVGMVDDIVRMLMGDGDVIDSTPPADEFDYGDWDFEGMDELGALMAAQGQVDYSSAIGEEVKEYAWSTPSIVTYEFGNNYDEANSGNWAEQAEKYEDGSWLISQSAELWRAFQKEMNKQKDFYKTNWGTSFSDDELDKFFQHVFTDIDAFVEAHDRKNNDVTYPSAMMRYNSLHWESTASHTKQLPDDNHDDTEVYVTVLDDGSGRVVIRVQFWKEV